MSLFLLYNFISEFHNIFVTGILWWVTTLINWTILLFQKWVKKNCVLCRNFISIYKINRTLHGRLGIRILSSCAERYVQCSKINFVSLRSHVISSIWFSRGNSYRSTKRDQTYSKRPRSLWPAHSKASWVKGWEIKQTFSIITCTCNQVTVGNSMLPNWQFLSIPFTCDIRMHNLLFCTQVSNLYKF